MGGGRNKKTGELPGFLWKPSPKGPQCETITKILGNSMILH